jgi:hypothetical protein
MDDNLEPAQTAVRARPARSGPAGGAAALIETAGRRRRHIRVVPVLLCIGVLAGMALASCGGKLRSPTEAANPTAPGTPALTFTEIQNQIFTPNCVKSGCHSTASASEGLVLAAGLAYASIVNRPATEEPQLDRIKPGNPAASYLLAKVRGDADITGARMPLDGPPYLTPQQIAGLTAWVEAGAPNN